MDEKKIITVENLRQFKDLYDVEIADGLLAKENTANKVTTITGESTDVQYPSAKAVRTYVEDNTIDETVDNLVNYTLKTETGSSIDLSINSSTYVMTLNLKDVSGNIISTDSVDLPLESMVVNATYDSENKKIVLILQSGSTIDVPVADLVSGLVSTEDLETILADYQLKSNYWIELTGSVKAATLTSGIYINTTNSRIFLYDDDNQNGFEIRPGGIFIIAPADNASYADYSIIYFDGKGGNFDTYSSASDRTTVFTVTVGFINTMTAMKHRVSSTYSFDLNPGLHGTTILKALQGFAANKTQMLVNTNGSISWTEGSLEDVKTQYSTMPTASAVNLGQIVQYTGVTDSTYTQGHFYTCVSDGQTVPTYSWQEISFGEKEYYIYSWNSKKASDLETLNEWYQEYKEGKTPKIYLCPNETHNQVLPLSKLFNNTLQFGEVNTTSITGNTSVKEIKTIYLNVSNGEVIDFTYRNYNYYLLQKGGTYYPIDNTTSFTPTNNYNLVHKKYVDDTALATVVADKLTGTTAPTTSTVGYVGQQYTDTTNNNQYVCTAVDTETPEYTWVQVNGGGSEQTAYYLTDYNITSDENKAKYKEIIEQWQNTGTQPLIYMRHNSTAVIQNVPVIIDKFKPETTTGSGKNIVLRELTAGKSTNSQLMDCTSDEITVYYTLTQSNGVYSVTITNATGSNPGYAIPLHNTVIYDYAGTSLKDGRYNMALSTNNTSAYTPASDYNPATKKYVDDSVAVIDSKLSTVYKYKGTVATYSALPSTDQTVGDVYNVEAADSTHGIKAGDNVAWTGTVWDVLAGTIDLSNYATTQELNELADVVENTATDADIDSLFS